LGLKRIFFRISFVRGKSVERRSRKAAKLSLSVGDESYAGWAAKGRKHGGAFLTPCLPPEHLLTKANPPKGGDAKLRD
jgi:hypothetical protein